MLIDVRNKNITGKAAEKALDHAGITVNKNTIPNDPASPFVTSGLRVGTPAVTTRGMTPDVMKQIAALMDEAIAKPEDEANLAAVKAKVNAICEKFPFYKF